uniref:Ig-like domain-containing protein n=1 Tax=Anas zonorhyncha TaxID=75864 RepID=A0A8B9UU97_9AVES
MERRKPAPITAGVSTTQVPLLCLPVPATKPIIRAGALGLTVPVGARTSLTCVAHGSPPISYRWFRAVPGGTALPLSSQAELTWDSLRPSDAGTYYCEAENRVGAGVVQRSDAVELVVRGESPACSSSPQRQEPVRQMVPVRPGIRHVAPNVNRVWIAAQEGSPALPLAHLAFAWLGTQAGRAANRLMSGLSHRVPSHTATHAWDQPAHRTPTPLRRQRSSPCAGRSVHSNAVRQE